MKYSETHNFISKFKKIPLMYFYYIFIDLKLSLIGSIVLTFKVLIFFQKMLLNQYLGKKTKKYWKIIISINSLKLIEIFWKFNSK